MTYVTGTFKKWSSASTKIQPRHSGAVDQVIQVNWAYGQAGVRSRSACRGDQR